MNKKVTAELLDKFMNNQCTADEIAMVYSWFNSYSSDDDYISGIDESEQDLIKEKILKQILSNIQNRELQTGIINYTKAPAKVSKLNSVWFKVAASVVLALTFSLLIFSHKKGTVKVLISNEVSFTNKNNSLYKITLSDNSIVWVSPKSSFTYPLHFQKGYRLVKMNGECFFEVAKGPNRPFIIESRHIITKVWGTSFRVRDDKLNNSPDVSVLTGKVSVSVNTSHLNLAEINKIQKNEVILLPRQMGVYRNSVKTITKQPETSNTGLNIWNRVNLSFEKTELSKIIPVLEKKFNVKISVTGPEINSEVLNADLNNFNLPDILTVLEKTFGINYVIENDHIILSGKTN